MAIDLAGLRHMHPILSMTTAAEYEYRAALGLARHGYRPGILFAVTIDGERERPRLYWQEAAQEPGDQLDFHRITEDAADALALATVHVTRGWTVLRRLQRRESADWLLVDVDKNRIAVEVSGVDGVDRGQHRLREKMRQVSRVTMQVAKVACVVELMPPRCRLKSA